ncbi:hypothetical protein EVD19_07930 [Elizabethkingia meningoseptica]|nr:hypothetical protein EVD19_07930 [Elizabethkingia meningoseptica]
MRQVLASRQLIFVGERKTLKIKYYETTKRSQKQIALETFLQTKSIINLKINIMKISFLAMSLLLSFATQIKAQEFPLQYTATDISNFASPNAAAFERYNESPINHYNGKANTTIPIYTIKIGNIEYPIALNYSHGGIQVNTISSDVGLGWGLTDTVINRVIVGDADFETFPNPYGDNITCKKNGLSQIGFQEKHGYDQKRKYQTIHAPVVNVDYYPDLFKFFLQTLILYSSLIEIEKP